MKLLFVFALVCTSLSAMAECYNFRVTEGPQTIGEAIFTKTPRTMCINVDSKNSNIVFHDGNRQVAVIEASIRRERSPLGEVVADLGKANVNSLVEDFRGITLTLKRGQTARGEREVVVENKSYFVTLK